MIPMMINSLMTFSMMKINKRNTQKSFPFFQEKIHIYNFIKFRANKNIKN